MFQPRVSFPFPFPLSHPNEPPADMDDFGDFVSVTAGSADGSGKGSSGDGGVAFGAFSRIGQSAFPSTTSTAQSAFVGTSSTTSTTTFSANFSTAFSTTTATAFSAAPDDAQEDDAFGDFISSEAADVPLQALSLAPRLELHECKTVCALLQAATHELRTAAAYLRSIHERLSRPSAAASSNPSASASPSSSAGRNSVGSQERERVYLLRYHAKTREYVKGVALVREVADRCVAALAGEPPGNGDVARALANAREALAQLSRHSSFVSLDSPKVRAYIS